MKFFFVLFISDLTYLIHVMDQRIKNLRTGFFLVMKSKKQLKNQVKRLKKRVMKLEQRIVDLDYVQFY